MADTDNRDTRGFGFAPGDRIRLSYAPETAREVIGYCCCGRLVVVSDTHALERFSDPTEPWEAADG